MARTVKQVVALGRIQAPGVAGTIASQLSLTEDDDCLCEGIIIQAIQNNTDTVFIGGVDANGDADVAANKAIIELAEGQGIVFEADENTGDEDRETYDLRKFSLLRASGTQYVQVSKIIVASKQYNR